MGTGVLKKSHPCEYVALHRDGPDSIRFYTKTKTVITRWPDPIHRGVDLGFPTAD